MTTTITRIRAEWPPPYRSVTKPIEIRAEWPLPYRSALSSKAWEAFDPLTILNQPSWQHQLAKLPAGSKPITIHASRYTSCSPKAHMNDDDLMNYLISKIIEILELKFSTLHKQSKQFCNRLNNLHLLEALK